MNPCQLLSTLLLIGAAAASAHADSFRTVQFLGTAQGSDPMINGLGGVTYTTYTPNAGVYRAMSEPGGILTTASASGSPAPGLPSGTNISFLGNVFPDSAGRPGFSAYLTGTGVTSNVNDYAVWSLNNGAPTVAMRLGDQAPGNVPGVTYLAQSNISPGAFNYNSRGDVTFNAYVTGPGITSANNRGVWTSQGGTTTQLAQLGSQAPGMPSGMVYSEFVNGGMNLAPLNGNGQSLISARTTGPGGATGEGVWMGGPSGMNLILQRGDAAPGLPGNTFAAFGGASINNQNHVAFMGYPDGPAGVSYGLWSGAPGSFSLLAATTQPAAAAGPGVSFGQIGGPALSGSDKVAFDSTLTGSGVTTSNDSSVWMYDGSGLKMLIREGMQAPGFPAGDKMGSVTLNDALDYAINSAGRVALAATYVDPLNNYHRAIWESSPSGNLVPVLSEGQTMVVNGATRTIQFLFTRLGESGLQDGQFTGFNENGQIAFVADFTDGTSGEFVFTPTPVPEPSTWALLAMGAGALLFRRRRR